MVQISRRFAGGVLARVGVSLALAALLPLGATRADAVVNPDYTSRAPATVLLAPSPSAPPLAAPRPLRTRLPITGADLLALSAAGAALLGVGAAVRATRRRSGA